MSRMRPSTREWLSARSHVHTDFDAADLVTDTNNEYGVARVLERWF